MACASALGNWYLACTFWAVGQEYIRNGLAVPPAVTEHCGRCACIAMTITLLVVFFPQREREPG
jgi:hypothetical protein